MAESKKGRNFAIQGPIEKKYVFAYFFCTYATYIKFQVPSPSNSLVLQLTKGITDRWTDRQTDGPKPICPLNFFEAGGIKNDDLEQESKLIKSYNQIVENFRRSWGDKIVSTDGRIDGRMDG